MRVIHVFLVALSLSGCLAAQVADSAADIAVMPAKALAKGVDLATTSQKELDKQEGRKLTVAKKHLQKQMRLMEKRCARGQALDTDTCPVPEKR